MISKNKIIPASDLPQMLDDALKNQNVRLATHQPAGKIELSPLIIGTCMHNDRLILHTQFGDKSVKRDSLVMINIENPDGIEADDLFARCHQASADAGWWQDAADVNLIDQANQRTSYGNAVVASKIALIHSEVSEAMEGHRKNLADDHLPSRDMTEVELADAIIRIADLAGALGYDLAGAITEKLDYNRRRADHKIENRRADGGKSY